MKTALSRSILFYALLLCCCTTVSFSQTAGFIYKPAGNALGKSVLDPNNDGWTSATVGGFSGTDYGSNSELKMVALPVMISEPHSDLLTGSNGGHTDIVSYSTNTSSAVYVLVKNVGGTDYLIVRFRIGRSSTASKGYSLLLETDQTFSTTSPLRTDNPGYDKEIVLETGNNGRVAIYTHTGTGSTLSHFYNVDNYSQRSIAASTNNADADYFYDYFVPLADIGANSFVRITASTITSASSGISGTISDFNGINDALYGSNTFKKMDEVNSTFPANVTLAMLTEGFSFTGSYALTARPPVITSNITTSSTTISGTSAEADGTTIYLYKNGSTSAFATATVSNNTWTATGITNGTLAAGNLITAKASVADRTISVASAAVEVTAVGSCYLPAPAITTRTNGSVVVSGTFAFADGSAISANTVRIRLYDQASTPTSYAEINANTTTHPSGIVYVGSNGQWSFTTNLGQNAFNDVAFYATATFGGCTSGYSGGSPKSGGGNSVAAAPTITAPSPPTTYLVASSTIARTVTVRNNHTAAAQLILYINGLPVDTSKSGGIVSTVAQNGTYNFNYTGFIEDQIVTSRAWVNNTTTFLSNASNSLIVVSSASPAQSSAPTITGSYLNTSTSVTGTSLEAAGTTIYLYSNGNLIGSTTVTGFGTWTVSGLTLTAGVALTAKADAAGKSLSNASNSVTVGTAANVPAPPVVTSPINVGATAIPGTGVASATVSVFVDGDFIGTTSVASIAPLDWSKSINATDIYKNAKVKATQTSGGLTSNFSNEVTVQGVDNFLIRNTSDGNIGNQIAGNPFDIKITARNSSNATFTNYSATNSVSGTYALTNGSVTAGFTSGVLSSHSITVTKAGTWTLTTVSTNDPTIAGTSNTFTVNAAAANKLVINTQVSPNNASNVAFGTQPQIYITDQYDNVVTTDNTTQVTAAIASGTGTLGGTVTVTAVNGVATFTNLKITGSGTYTLQFTSNPALTAPTSTSFNVTSNLWKGSVSTDFNTAANWTNNIVPASGDAVVFDAAVQRDLILTGNKTIGDFVNNQTTYHLKVNGNKLTVTGSFTQPSGATIEASTSEIEMAGTAAQTVPAGTFVDDKVCKFTVNNTNGVTLQDTVIITCRITPTAGTLTTGGVLVIGSDATKDAVVASGSGTISGKVIVERYIPAKRAWRILTSPLKNTGRFYNNWQNGGSYIPGIGTLVSGPTAGQSVNGLDVTTQQNTSLFTYNGTTNAWDAVTNTLNFNLSDSASSAASKGYLIFIRGDRDPANAVVGAYNQTTLRATGELQSGDQTYTINAATNKFNLIANPYACPIDLNAIYLDNSTKINRKFWYYDPKGPDLGQYVTVTWNAVANQYDIVPGDQPYQTRYIQNGQAFFVQTITGGIADPLNANITIKETHKSPDNVYLVYRSGSQLERMRIYLRGVNNDGSRDRLDGVLANFHNSYSAGIGDEDASKFLNFNESLSLRRNNRSLSIEGRPLMSDGDTLFLYLNSLKVKNYEFSIEPSSFSAPGLEAYLEDAFLNTSTALSLSNTTTVQFSVTSNTQSSAATRFRIVFRQSGVLPVTFNNIKAYSKDNKQVNVEWSVSNESGIIEYYVERSVDGRAFNQIGSVKAKNVTDYSFTDQNPVAGVNFYRVKSAGVNGEVKYTSVAKVSLTDKNSHVQVYPNPATGGNINLQLNNLKQGIYTINVMNAVGQIVFSSQVNHAGGSSSQVISIKGIVSKGVYQLNVTGADSRQTQRFIIE